ncbi:MAG: PEP-CTERM sorting domain-containing protein [Lacipirellulaceae bacterium]
MKFTKALLVLSVALCLHSSASAAIIVAGIDNWDSTTAPTVPVTAAGVTATATASAVGGTENWSISDGSGRGSSGDTTWGTFDGNGVPASSETEVGPANFTLQNARTDGQVTLTIANNGAADIVLEAFHMDALAFRPKAARTYALNVLSGDITNGNVFTSDAPMNDNSTNAITHLGGGLSGHDQHDDLDLDLTGLADNVLEAGGSVVIQIAFSNGVGDGSGGHHLFLDNVAVSGSVVPEPSSLVLLGMMSLVAVGRKRR